MSDNIELFAKRSIHYIFEGKRKIAMPDDADPFLIDAKDGAGLVEKGFAIEAEPVKGKPVNGDLVADKAIEAEPVKGNSSGSGRPKKR